MQQHHKRIHGIIIVLCVLIQIGLTSFFYDMTVDAQESSIIIEVSDQVVQSNQNFTVSVYDPMIQIGTPYLVNVTIVFNDQYYQITPLMENGELIITAPEVFLNRTYLIEAYTSYKHANTTITVTPGQNKRTSELFIILDTYSFTAFEPFTVLITDESGQPVDNTTLSVTYSGNIGKMMTTKSDGTTTITPPNEPTITIIAEKPGYETVQKSISIMMKEGLLDSFFSHPYTPIIGSIMILTIVIFYISIYRRKKEILVWIKAYKLSKKKRHQPWERVERVMNKDKPINPVYNKEPLQYLKVKGQQTKDFKSLPYTHSLENKKMTHHHHQWFPRKNTTIQRKNDKRYTDQKTHTHSIDAIHKKIDLLIDDR